MKLKMMILATLLFAGGVQAQNNANGLLKKVLDKMTAYKDFKANFSYRMDNKEVNIHEKKVGLIFVKGNKYRVETPEAIIISDGHVQWNLYTESKSGTINEVDTTDLLSGSPGKILSKYVKYKAKYEKVKGNRKSVNRTIVLTDKKEKTYDKIVVKVDASKLLLNSFSLFSKDGNVYTISLSHLKANLSLPDNTFILDKQKYKDFDIEDMR